MTKKYLEIGVGRFGASVVRELSALGHDVVACDQDEHALEQVNEHTDYAVIGDATADNTLDELEVLQYEAIIVSTADNFEASIVIIAKLKKRGCSAIIAKCNEAFRGEILSEVIGADRVVFPEEETGQRLARQLVTPGLKEYIALSPYCDGMEMDVPAAFFHKSIRELDLRNRYNVLDSEKF